MSSIKFYKNSGSVLDYSLDWSSFLSGGDTIVASDWLPDSTDISVDSSTFTSTSATAWISGGLSGIEYNIVNHITTAFGREDYKLISIFVIDAPNEISDLIYELRIHLGDTSPTSYRYTDDWLFVAIESAIKALQRWWGDKYIFDTTGQFIVRNASYRNFIQDSPPEIQDRDRRPIILMASILIKSGQLEANSWNVGSWKDAEIAVSNIEGSRAKQFGANLDWEELKSYLTPPTKRLLGALRVSHIITED